NVAENHQYHNAMAMVNRDAAMIIEEKDLTSQLLCKTVEDLFAKTGRVEEMAANAKKMAILDANERIYKIIKDIVG
ncbi:MAG: glycosyltransferase, partial [Acutalibacteraceae bacterium]|nr:glycosyltransferase [Acutalibacteraceae bacterium]